MDYYETLGVNHTTDAKGIKNAYRKLASKHHPDKGGNAEQFKKVQEAYDVLGDPQKKHEYDNPNPYSQFTSQGQPFDINDIFGGGSPFGDIFGQRRPQQPRQQMYRTTIQVSLKQAYTGSDQALEMNTPQGKKVITIKIPKGVQTGQQMRIENAIPGGVLVVDFFVQQDFNYDVRGHNLFCVHSVSVLDLIVGTTFTFKTISDWPWVYDYYEFEVDFSLEEIKKIQIDPSTRLADVNLENNIWTVNTNQDLTAPEIIFKSKL